MVQRVTVSSWGSSAAISSMRLSVKSFVKKMTIILLSSMHVMLDATEYNHARLVSIAVIQLRWVDSEDWGW